MRKVDLDTRPDADLPPASRLGLAIDRHGAAGDQRLGLTAIRDDVAELEQLTQTNDVPADFDLHLASLDYCVNCGPRGTRRQQVRARVVVEKDENTSRGITSGHEESVGDSFSDGPFLSSVESQSGGAPMTLKKVAKILWSPVKRVDELLRVDSDVADLYPDAHLSTRDAAITDAITGMQAQAHTGHIGL